MAKECSLGFTAPTTEASQERRGGKKAILDPLNLNKSQLSPEIPPPPREGRERAEEIKKRGGGELKEETEKKQSKEI